MATALDIATNVTGAAITQAQEKVWLTSLRAALAEMGDPIAQYGVIQNLGFSLSVAASALTIALKTRALADADANNPITAPFRNATVATGDFSVLNLIAAHSLVVSSGSTLGTRNGIPFRLWFVAFNDAGTWRLGVINCVTTAAGAGSGSEVSLIYPLKGFGIGTSIAEGGAGAADSAQVFYTGVAATVKAFVVLGYASWESGLATAGTWSSGPTRVQPYGLGVPLPGDVVQSVISMDSAVANSATVTPYDDTIPQNTEGLQVMSQNITPISATNILSISHLGHYGNNTGADVITVALHQDAVANALKALPVATPGANVGVTASLSHRLLAASTTTTAIKVRAGCTSNAVTFNGTNAARRYGGVSGSILAIDELMG